MTMLLRGEKDPKMLVRLGMFFLLLFFCMGLLPHPTSSFGDGVFDGVRGVFFGAGSALALWAAYLNGRLRRQRSNH
jgi:hypothetical protein